MSNQPKQIKFAITTGEGEEKKVTNYLVTVPDAKQRQEGQKVYNRAFSDAVSSGALIRAKLQDFMEEQGLWNEGKEKEFKELQDKILKAERKLAKGGFALSEAKALSLEVRKLRNQMRELIASRTELDVHTAEGQADNARFNFWVSDCLVYNDTKKPVYGGVDEYLNSSTNEVAIQGAQALAKLMYGLTEDFESKLPENQFLKEFNFVDDELRLINEDGHLVDESGRLIDDTGRYINEKGEKVDRDGNPLDEDGNYAFERKPFLDDSGNPVTPPSSDEAKSVEETEAVKAGTE